MAGTRGIAQLRGDQLRSKIMSDRHFDAANKINEDKVDLKWTQHREILEATKIDVFVQSNNNVIQGLNSLDITSIIGSHPVAVDGNTEGVVTNTHIDIRETGTEDFPFIDADGDRVYGKVRFDGTGSKYFLDFFSMQPNGSGGEIETAYTFAVGAINLDFRYILRTNLSVIPVDSLIKGGSGFVEGATDANAYMNLTQLMKDLYGASGTLDNDGNSNLSKSIVQQIADESTDRGTGDQDILDGFAAAEGAGLVGVITDPNYIGLTVQSVLSSLASRLNGLEIGSGQEVTNTHSREAGSANLYFAERSGLNSTTTFNTLEERLLDVETVVDTEVKNHETRVTKLETEDEREIYEATGGETSYTLVKAVARPNTLFVSLNGSLLTPTVNYSEVVDGNSNITGISFAPTILSAGTPPDTPPDVLFVWYKKVFS